MFSLSVRSGVRPQLPKKCWKGVIFSNLGQCLWGGGEEEGEGEEKVEMREEGRKSLKMSGKVVKKEKDDAKRGRSFRLDYITDMIRR